MAEPLLSHAAAQSYYNTTTIPRNSQLTPAPFMLPHLRHAAVPTPFRLLGRACAAGRAVRAKSTASQRVTQTPMAEKLEKAGVWAPKTRSPRGSKGTQMQMRPQDARRVNIVSEKLCDDIIERLGPSLERHRGCDLIDLNPGCSIWSRALHDAVQPRQHLMLDANAKQNKPFRDEAMGDRKITMIPKSGIIWDELNQVFEQYIDPHHKRVNPGEQPHRNDQLLITANVSTFPNKSVWKFPNLATLILYQYLASIRTSTIFQKYGSVRMLIWTNDDSKRRVLPRSILGRKRPAFEAELSCEYIHEVAGSDELGADGERFGRRDQWLHYESAANALRRMEQDGVTTPPGRETNIMKILKENPSLLTEQLAGVRMPLFDRPYQVELAEMRDAEPPADRTPEKNRMYQLEYRERRADRDGGIFLDLLQHHETMLHLDPSSDKFIAMDREFDERLEGYIKNVRADFLLARDNYHIFRHHKPHPSLLWDRRPYDPLAVSPEEFYPNEPSCLLDIQPKRMDPLFLQYGPQTSRSGDFAELILKSLFGSPAHPLHPRLLDSVWPGYADMAAKMAPSLWDPAYGGSPSQGYGRVSVRAMSERHFTELVNAWMKWPFRPEYHQFLGRSMEVDEQVEM